MPVIGILLLIAILWWAWPLLLALGLAFLAYSAYKSKQVLNREALRKKNMEGVQSLLPQLKSTLVGLYGAQEKRGSPPSPMGIIKIIDITLGARKLAVEYCIIMPADDNSRLGSHIPCELSSNIFLKMYSKVVPLIEISGGERSDDYLLEDLAIELKNLLGSSLSIKFYGELSVESRLAEVIFLNTPEAQWASSAINQIEKALAPVSAAYDISLTNELLHSNQKYLLRAIDVMHKEISNLQEYVQEASSAIRKAYEFLSIPSSLRSFTELDTKPLEIFSRKQEMRAGFQEAVAIKKEYDILKGGD